MTNNQAQAGADPFTSHTVTVNGLRLHARRLGNASQTVVLLHGFPQTGRSWEKVARQLAPQFTVIAPDLRGAGESGRPATGYDKKTMAADLHKLLQTLDLGRVHLVGHDIGMVAYAYAAQWPESVVSLTLIEMLLPGFGIEAMYAIRQPGRFAHMPFFMAQDLPEWLLAGKEAAFIDWFIRSNIMDQDAFSPEEMAVYMHAYARPSALRAAFDWFRSFWQDAEDNQAWAAAPLTMPVLAIGGSASVGSMLEQSLRPLANDLRGLVLEDCGHFVPDEQSLRLARELAAFF